MKKLFQLSVLLIITISLSFYGFQCSSTEITSARLYLQQKNFDKAEESLKKELSKNSQSEEGYFLLGYVNYEKKNYSDMQENFKKAMGVGQKFEKEIKGYLLQAWADNLNQGVQFFSQANKLQDKEKQKETMNKAIKNFETAINLQPDSAETYKNLAYSYININDYESAIPPMEKYIQKTENLDGYKILSDLYLSKAEINYAKFKDSNVEKDSVNAMNGYNKLITLLEKGLTKYPGNEDLNTKLLNGYISVGKKDYAVQRMKELYEKNPNDKVLNYNYGTVLMSMEQYENGAKLLNSAYEIDNAYEPAIRNLIVCYYKWGMKVREVESEKNTDVKTFRQYFEKALPLVQRLLVLKPEDSKLYLILGDVYANLGESVKAKEAYEKGDKLQKEGK